MKNKLPRPIRLWISRNKNGIYEIWDREPQFANGYWYDPTSVEVFPIRSSERNLPYAGDIPYCKCQQYILKPVEDTEYAQ